MAEALAAPGSRHSIHRRSRRHNHRRSRGYRAHLAGPDCHGYSGHGHRNHPGSRRRRNHYFDSRYHNRRSRHRTHYHIPRPGPEYIG